MSNVHFESDWSPASPDWHEDEAEECPWCGHVTRAGQMAAHVRQHVGGISRSGYNPRPDEDPVYRREMKDAGRGRLLS